MVSPDETEAAHGADLCAKSRDPQGREKAVIDSVTGRNGGNSRVGTRIDVPEDTAKLLEDLMKPRKKVAGL